MEIQFRKVDLNNTKSLYLQITDIIEQKILKNEIKVGQKLPPHEDLCRIFNVSSYTIKEALANLVKDGYITRRRNYGTVVISSRPVSKFDIRRNGICMVVCQANPDSMYKNYLEHPFTNSILNAVEKKVKEKSGYLIYNSVENGELSFSGKENEIAGLIVAGTITQSMLERIKKTRIPFVLDGDVHQKQFTGEDIDVVAGDDFQAGYMAAKHLIELGHKRIVYMDRFLDKFSWQIQRVLGYRQALTEAGIAYDRSLLLEAKSPDLTIGYTEIKELLSKHTEFSAMIAVGNVLSLNTIKAIRENNMRVPEDVSIVNIGQFEPGLASVMYNLNEVGTKLAERLFEKISNPSSKPTRIIVQNEMFIQNSTLAAEQKN